MSSVRLFLSFPEDLVDQPIIYEAVRRFDVIPNIRRANVEAHSGWVILEIGGDDDKVEDAISYFREVGVSVNRMEGDVLES
ncbi:MAG TPA: NIL domain-containing protein [Acidimicrobiia bacterium]|nr:NIL domain-containing protein [Acidimicrobiia bacterium]